MQQYRFGDTGVVNLPSNTSDPSGTNGDVYYNSATFIFRAFSNGVWVDMIPVTSMKFISSSPYTVLPADDGQILVWGIAGPLTINVATGLRNGWQIEVWQDSTGTITFADAGGATIHSRGELKNTAGQYAGVTLCHLAGGQFRLAGDLA